MSHTLKKLANGRWVDADGKPDDIVRDGEAVRVSLVMLDGKASKDSQLDNPRDAYVRRLGASWSNAENQQPFITTSPTAAVVKPTADGSGAGHPSQAYLQYCRRLEDGYRHAVSGHVAV